MRRLLRGERGEIRLVERDRGADATKGRLQQHRVRMTLRARVGRGQPELQTPSVLDADSVGSRYPSG